MQTTVLSGLGLLFTPWLFDSALLLSGLVTIASIVFLLALLKAGHFTATTLSFAAVFYLVFAAGLIPLLT
ncbi:hypothetical protein ACFHYQ_01085 [Sphaerimonospora cavernae]|uniref:DoxX-like protein n=1 Tax=Sphaerimonospora cavernae TaxID=1740611 RepID=A0ABV6TYP9_9ACTN